MRISARAVTSSVYLARQRSVSDARRNRSIVDTSAVDAEAFLGQQLLVLVGVTAAGGGPDRGEPQAAAETEVLAQRLDHALI